MGLASNGDDGNRRGGFVILRNGHLIEFFAFEESLFFPVSPDPVDTGHFIMVFDLWSIVDDSTDLESDNWAG